MEIGDLHYFDAPPRAFHAPSPRCRRAAALLVAATTAAVWLALLLMNVEIGD